MDLTERQYIDLMEANSAILDPEPKSITNSTHALEQQTQEIDR
jgi:hypothetical protein